MSGRGRPIKTWFQKKKRRAGEAMNQNLVTKKQTANGRGRETTRGFKMTTDS